MHAGISMGLWYILTGMTVRDTNTHQLTNASKFWARWLENWAGLVEFYIEEAFIFTDSNWS